MDLKAIQQFPHCDSRILHAPGECTYCDQYPEWQDLRKVWGINFTGKTEPSLQPCPADKARGGSHKMWYGNVAYAYPCKNCKREPGDHADDGRCLYSPGTNYEPNEPAKEK
jgi:hypothetical protein